MAARPNDLQTCQSACLRRDAAGHVRFWIGPDINEVMTDFSNCPIPDIPKFETL